MYSCPASRYPTWNGSPGGIPPPPPPVPASLPATSLPTPPTPPALLPRLAVSTTWTLSTAILPRSLRRYGQRGHNSVTTSLLVIVQRGGREGGREGKKERKKTRASGRKRTDHPLCGSERLFSFPSEQEFFLLFRNLVEAWRLSCFLNFSILNR